MLRFALVRLYGNYKPLGPREQIHTKLSFSMLDIALSLDLKRFYECV